jgi:hypothetical protein
MQSYGPSFDPDGGRAGGWPSLSHSSFSPLRSSSSERLSAAANLTFAFASAVETEFSGVDPLSRLQRVRGFRRCLPLQPTTYNMPLKFSTAEYSCVPSFLLSPPSSL